MVAVTHAAPQAAAPQAVGAWLDTLAPVYTDADRSRFASAYEMARDAFGDARHAEGERLIDRALGTAGILAAQRLDPDSLTAALDGVCTTALVDLELLEARRLGIHFDKCASWTGRGKYCH